MKILDWNDYEKTARCCVAEGCVLLENNGVLPLKKNQKVSIFGRIQANYFKSGTGSGGKVNVDKVWNIGEALENSGRVSVNKELEKVYDKWIEKNPFDEGLGWGMEPWAQKEMPLSEKIVSDARAESDVALVMIGRTAGEDKDNSLTEGSYLLSEDEKNMLRLVRNGFDKMVVLLNVGNIIDMSFVDEFKPDAVMYIWQGGMVGCLGTADVLTGDVNPCGKLTDTIACNMSDYPSDKWFGGENENFYCEDIFVGYRYFETFAKEKVRYPFGYGLSYSDFEILPKKFENCFDSKTVNLSVEVLNKGEVDGKEVVQVYVKCPNGKLGKAERVLVDFEKTSELKKSCKESIEFEIPYYSFASFDDEGVAGRAGVSGADISAGTAGVGAAVCGEKSSENAWVLESGEYVFYAGSDVRSACEIGRFCLEDLLILQQCKQACAPVRSFDRMCRDENGNLVMKKVPLCTVDMREKRIKNLPSEICQVHTENYKLRDVLENKVSMEDFVAQFTDDDLACIIRGEGMGSSLVTAGTASAFGGVSPRLRETFGIPAVCCDDGPSGMRNDCGAKAFSLPNGTCLACTFNKSLVESLYSFTGLEMCSCKVENLLGPGMNIHRHPLNGRNFEYFSEDPVVTGKIGLAMIKGLMSAGVTGTIKHFCANNQETRRHWQDSVISQRALREIYLKGFEIAVRNGANSVMTTYGKLNGLYTSSSYDLNTVILRKEWGFKGIVMTDWWAFINEIGCEPDKSNFAAMVRAQNDLYMCCSDGSRNADGDNTLVSLQNGNLTRAELQRAAMNICNHVMHSQAMARLMGTNEKIEIINRPASKDDANLDDVIFYVVEHDKPFEIDLSQKRSVAGTNYILSFDVRDIGTYRLTLFGSSELGELAQLPCSLFFQGIPTATFVFNGSKGKTVSITKDIACPTRFSTFRLFVSQNGLKLDKLKVEFVGKEFKSFFNV